jgi:hypothetical protein
MLDYSTASFEPKRAASRTATRGNRPAGGEIVRRGGRVAPTLSLRRIVRSVDRQPCPLRTRSASRDATSVGACIPPTASISWLRQMVLLRAESRDACFARACASRLCPRFRSCSGRAA